MQAAEVGVVQAVVATVSIPCARVDRGAAQPCSRLSALLAARVEAVARGRRLVLRLRTAVVDAIVARHCPTRSAPGAATGLIVARARRIRRSIGAVGVVVAGQRRRHTGEAIARTRATIEHVVVEQTVVLGGVTLRRP